MKKDKIQVYSPLHKKFLKKERNNKIKVLTIQFAIIILFFLVWELAAQLKLIDDFITSSPSRIIATIKNMAAYDMMRHIGITLIECIIGFLSATAIGVFIAILLWWFETARKVLEPFVVVLNALPKIALGPLIIIWVGAGYSSIIMMTILICVIVTIMSTLSGFMSLDEGKLLLMRSMGASKFQILFKLILPYSIPNFISILKINVGLAWVGVIMGEYLVSAAGLGYLIIYGGQVFKLDLVMASTLILCGLAALMYVGVSMLEKCFTRFK